MIPGVSLPAPSKCSLDSTNRLVRRVLRTGCNLHAFGSDHGLASPWLQKHERQYNGNFRIWRWRHRAISVFVNQWKIVQFHLSTISRLSYEGRFCSLLIVDISAGGSNIKVNYYSTSTCHLSALGRLETIYPTSDPHEPIIYYHTY